MPVEEAVLPSKGVKKKKGKKSGTGKKGVKKAAKKGKKVEVIKSTDTIESAIVVSGTQEKDEHPVMVEQIDEMVNLVTQPTAQK